MQMSRKYSDVTLKLFLQCSKKTSEYMTLEHEFYWKQTFKMKIFAVKEKKILLFDRFSLIDCLLLNEKHWIQYFAKSKSNSFHILRFMSLKCNLNVISARSSQFKEKYSKKSQMKFKNWRKETENIQ
jgi:hypothetical protein